MKKIVGLALLSLVVTAGIAVARNNPTTYGVHHYAQGPGDKTRTIYVTDCSAVLDHWINHTTPQDTLFNSAPGCLED